MTTTVDSRLTDGGSMQQLFILGPIAMSGQFEPSDLTSTPQYIHRFLVAEAFQRHAIDLHPISTASLQSPLLTL